MTRLGDYLNDKSWCPDWLHYVLSGAFWYDQIWWPLTGHGQGGTKRCNRKTCCPDAVPTCKEQHGVPVYRIRPLVRFASHPGVLWIETSRKGDETEYKYVGIDLEVN